MVGNVPDLKVRLGEIRLGEQAAPRADRRPAEIGGGLHLQHLDHQRVAGGGAAHAHGTRERVAAERPASEHVGMGGVLRVVAVGGIARVEGHRVTGVDLEAGLEGIVPLVVHLVRGETVRGGHGRAVA